MTTLPQKLLSPNTPPAMGWLFIAQIFAVFFTGVKILPGLRNNFGPFEIVGGIFILSYVVSLTTGKHSPQTHPVIRIQALLAFVGLLSLLWFQGPELKLGIVQVLILIFQLLFVLTMYNLMLQYQISPEKLLRLVTYSALVIGPWILFSGLDSQIAIQEVGPFRNRAHMANYMLTAFWLVLLFNSWPGINKKEKLLSFLALGSTLYPIAISGRRSVYLSLIFGLVGIGLSFLFAARGRRQTAVVATAVVFGTLGLMYLVGPRWLPQLEFFQSRVSGIGERLEMAVGDANQGPTDNFFEMQISGVFAAVKDYPIAGIGWGAFYNSRYSISGHEVHSTPLRFLAELGLIGLSLYATLMGILLVGSLRIIALLRTTAYRTPAVILAVALWSLSISFIYNRHITERTFWLLLLFYLSFEAFARTVAWRQEHDPSVRRSVTRQRPARQAAAALARSD